MTTKFSREGLLETQVLMVFCIDTSGSLLDFEEQINSGVSAFFEELKKYPEANNKTEVAFVTYDTDVNVLMDFTKRIKILPRIKINENGVTNMGDGIIKSLDLVMKRYRDLRNKKERVYIPYVVLFTDGHPYNSEGTAEKKMIEAKKILNRYEGLNDESKYQINFISIGVGNVDQEQMRKISIIEDRFIMLDQINHLSHFFKFLCSVTMHRQMEIESLNNSSSDFEDVKSKNSKVVKPTIFSGKSWSEHFKHENDN